nr:lysosomal alpha-mannosidase-like [Onthophagus taurus]
MFKLIIACLFVNIIGFVVSVPTNNRLESSYGCNYEACHPVDPEKLNVHLVAHSHDDVGWLKTVDQYYYGAKNYIQQAGVENIISSVVEALDRDPNRRFIQVETAFFWQWWKLQSERTRQVAKELVDNGRLEIINGAWSMNDEAAAHYHSIIDQFTWGLKTIDDTVGKCGRPKIGWQIDPFGHSKEMATIFSQIGYEAVFFARLDYRDNINRHIQRDLEMIWQGSQDLGNSSNIFTGVLYDFYTAPAYFCWDVLCSDMPIVDDETSPEYNLDDRVEEFADYVLKGASNFKTKHLLVTMGGDFTYQAAEMYFINMDRLIAGFKKLRPDINVIYSTPSCYVKAVNEAAKAQDITYQVKTDDFFPYASDAHSYWTGYFTSRPNSKRNERMGNNFLQVIKQLNSFKQFADDNDDEDNSILLKEAMGIMQHHDAITGTEKQHVAQDYARLVTKGIHAAEEGIDSIIANLLKKTDDVSSVTLPFKSCLLANVSHCEASSFDTFTVAVYNPLSRNVNHYVRLPVSGDSYTVTGPKGVVSSAILPTIHDFEYVDEITPLSQELVFLAKDVPPLGLQYYYVDKSTRQENVTVEVQEIRLGTTETGFEIDSETGLLKTVTMNGITLPVTQNFMYYNGANGTNIDGERRASGAYIFRPAKSTPEALPISTQATYKVYTSDLVDEVHQEFNDWVKQIIRVYKENNHIEFDWLIGPIESPEYQGVEVVTRFITDLKTDATFYTDSNGRQMVKRVRNFRETYEYTNEEPVSGNYYPITSKITLQDLERNIEFAVLNDRAQGGGSLNDGEVELMVHRRLLNDDNFGVGEALNEYEFGQGVVVRGQHYLTLGSMNSNSDGKSSAAQQRDLAAKKLLAPWVVVAPASDSSLENLSSKLNFEFSGLTRSLPENVQILTLEPWGSNKVLFRLEHTLSNNEDATLSQPAEVNIDGLFTLFDIVDMQEMNLAGNVPIDEIDRMEWNGVSSVKTQSQRDVQSPIVLKPMAIRTFILTITKKN